MVCQWSSPPDDEGLDLGDAPPLPDEGQELPGLPDDYMFGDRLVDADWLESSLANIVVSDEDAVRMETERDASGATRL